jgi:Protein of unknown function (DUF2938)
MGLSAVRVLGLGLMSTLLMDLLTGVSIWLRLIAPLPPALVGRWFASLARARVVHADIAHVAPISHEGFVMLPIHYAIGTLLAGLYVWAASRLGWPPRSLSAALLFGLCTNVLPWLLMFPAMGYGLFGVHGPAGTRLLFSSLITHAFFGIGLWFAARALGM